MSEFILQDLAFTSLYGEQHTVSIGMGWEVFFGSEESKRYLAPAAVLILGFANSLNSVASRDDFYKTVLSGYDGVVNDCRMPRVPEIDNARTGTNLGKRLSDISLPLMSPLKTNIIQLQLGIQKKLLFCSNPANEELVGEIIGNSALSENPETNERFQKMLLDSYKLRKDFMLARPGRSRTPVKSGGS